MMKKFAALVIAVLFSMIMILPSHADGTNPKPPENRAPITDMAD
jgi:hypothetical protein